MTNNMQIWDAVSKTPVEYTKPFKRAGGFSGRSIYPVYMYRCATELFGPVGIGWGWDELENKIVDDIWFIKVKLWYVWNYQLVDRGPVQYGATQYKSIRVYNGVETLFVDEEAPKKSVTDAVTKCLSCLGIGADIYMGMYDDNKYLAEMQREKEGREAPAPPSPPAKPERPFSIEVMQREIEAEERRIGTRAYLRILGPDYESAKDIRTRDEGLRVWALLRKESETQGQEETEEEIA